MSFPWELLARTPSPTQLSPAQAWAALGTSFLTTVTSLQAGSVSPGPHLASLDVAPGLPEGYTRCSIRVRCQFLPVLAWLLFLTWPGASHRWGARCLRKYLYLTFSLFIFCFENKHGRSYCLMGTESAWEEEKILEMDGGDGCRTI